MKVCGESRQPINIVIHTPHHLSNLKTTKFFNPREKRNPLIPKPMTVTGRKKKKHKNRLLRDT